MHKSEFILENKMHKIPWDLVHLELSQKVWKKKTGEIKSEEEWLKFSIPKIS